MNTFQVQVLGADNGSGVFETGGDVKTFEVSVESLLPGDFIPAIIEKLNAELGTVAGRYRTTGESISVLGPHRVISFVLNEDEAGESSWVFLATESA